MNPLNKLTFLGGLLLVLISSSGLFWLSRYLFFDKKTVALTANSQLHNQNSSLGIGLSGVSYWSTQLPFLNQFKSSSSWLTQCVKNDPGCQGWGEWNTEESKQLNLDENGWIKSLPAPEDEPKFTRVSALLLRDISNQFPGGKYIVLYDGEGKIEYKFAAKKIDSESKPGRDVIEVDATKDDGVLLTLTSTDPNKTGNYIRNIRVIKAEDEPRYQKGELFNPRFIKKIQKFRALRFMDWQATNNSQQKNWQDRPQLDHATYTQKGVPIEVMIALSNQLQSEPWFNMPHQATDEYITEFSKLVKQKLDPNLKVYVEFSNEVWNWQFKQSHYALEQGKARWGEDLGDAYMQWYGMRSGQTCEIWKKTFAGQENQVVCVISTHTAWKGLEKAMLDCPAWVAEGNKPCYQYGIDAYGITGYFSGNLGHPENTSTVESWLKEPDQGISKGFQQLQVGGLTPHDQDSLVEANKRFLYHADVAKERNLQLVAYEGGQHITGIEGVENNKQLTEFFIELNRNPEMYKTYLQLLDNWKQAGGTLFMHFVDVSQPSKWGSWGALESLNQTESPKYNALIDFIDNNPCWWEECKRN